MLVPEEVLVGDPRVQVASDLEAFLIFNSVSSYLTDALDLLPSGS